MNPTRNEPCPCGSGLKFKKCCGKIVANKLNNSFVINQNNKQEYIGVIDHDVKVVVPDSLELITPYVIREQEDWFEDEIIFIRNFIQPGMRVLDIGANYGLYTLSMAKKVGETGHVLAVEPASTTVSYLKKSVDINKFENIKILQIALSDKNGIANLSLNENSELNMLCQENDLSCTEEVAVRTLDSLCDEKIIENIDFIKIDAEGEEDHIIDGGMSIFSRESPLVMFELKHGKLLNINLIRKFGELGYGTYKLIKGLNILAPFDASEIPDAFQLNLFCCKKKYADDLEKRGLLASSKVRIDFALESDESFMEKYLESREYASKYIRKWHSLAIDGKDDDKTSLWRILKLYYLSHDTAIIPSVRLSALLEALHKIELICDSSPDIGKLCIKIRISWELGMREQSVECLFHLLGMFAKEKVTAFSSPFIPVCKRFDKIEPNDNLEHWLLASILEQYELLRSFSSFYTGDKSLHNLIMLARTGFISTRMERRLELIQKRYG